MSPTEASIIPVSDDLVAVRKRLFDAELRLAELERVVPVLTTTLLLHSDILEKLIKVIQASDIVHPGPKTTESS